MKGCKELFAVPTEHLSITRPWLDNAGLAC